MPPRQVAAKIRALRQARGWSQVRLADESRLDPAAVARYENEEIVPTLDVLDRIAAAFGLELAALFDDDAQQGPPPARNLLRSIASNIRQARDAKGWSQSRLADAAGFDAGSISRIETLAAAVMLESLERIADALEVPIVQLLTVPPAGERRGALTAELLERWETLAPRDRRAVLALMQALSSPP